MKYNPIICALDFANLDDAVNMITKIKDFVGGVKLGLEFFVRNGFQGVKEISKLDVPIFLDLKLHDIPNTVVGALNVVKDLNIFMTTLHITGGREMLEKSVEAVQYISNKKINLVGVTFLTSMTDEDAKGLGFSSDIKNSAINLVKLALESGLDGVVCSAKELSTIYDNVDSNFITVVPGIRRVEDGNNDQKRVASPGDAIKSGAKYLVIGRPITKAQNPEDSARQIYGDVKSIIVN